MTGIELLEPIEHDGSDFLRRFVARNGPGPHHFTFKTPTFAGTVEAGYNVIAPMTGIVTLPRHVAWSGQGALDLDDPVDRNYAYEILGGLHRWLRVIGHDDRLFNTATTSGGVQYGSEAERVRARPD